MFRAFFVATPVGATFAAIEIWQSAVPDNGPMLAQMARLDVDIGSLQHWPMRMLAPVVELAEDATSCLAEVAAFGTEGTFGNRVLRVFGELAGDLAGLGTDAVDAAVGQIRGQTSDAWGWGLFPRCFHRSPWSYALVLVGVTMAALEQARRAAYGVLHRNALQLRGLDAAVALTAARIRVLTASGATLTKESFVEQQSRADFLSTPTRRPASLEDKTRSDRRARSAFASERSERSRAGSAGARAGWASLSPSERSAKGSEIANRRWSTSPGPK